MSYATFPVEELGPVGGAFLKTVHWFGLADVQWVMIDKKHQISVNNLTIINFVLKFIGPTHERTLTIYMILIQVCY